MSRLYLKATGIDKFEWVDRARKKPARTLRSGNHFEEIPRCQAGAGSTEVQQVEPGWIISVDVDAIAEGCWRTRTGGVKRA